MKRRSFVKQSTLAAFSMAAFGSISWNGKSFEGDTPTTTDILGPFYRPGAPMRSDLVPSGAKAEVMNLSGTVFKTDGKTPLSDVMIEAWQCDEHEKYDNTSDEYVLRGTVKTDKNGRYAFRTIVPVPYKDGDAWRPAHIHMRISSRDHQDLITQIYFKGDPHIAGDGSAAKSADRVLEIKKVGPNENAVKFDVVLAKTYPLDDAGYRKITGIYRLKDGMVEFNRKDDLLFAKINGQLMEGLVYKGNNTFEGGLGFNKVKFEILANGDVNMKMTMWENWSANEPALQFEGKKVLKYAD